MRGAGGGRPRKPEGTTRHRNQPTRNTIVVAADARVQRVPEPAFPLSGVRRSVWDAMWAQPIAILWNDVDIAALTRLVVMQTTPKYFEDRGLLAEMRQLEDRFLLNPYARAQQRVEIREDDDSGEEVTGDVSWIDDARRRLQSG